jgi:hypothetical protein
MKFFLNKQNTLLFFIVLLFLSNIVFSFSQTITTKNNKQQEEQQVFYKYNIYTVKDLYKATLCISDSNFIPFTKIDTVGSTLHLNINLDSLRILKPGKLSYINFQMKNEEACVIPVKIWIKTMNKSNPNNIEDTQYIEQNIAFLHSSNNYVSFYEPVILKNSSYEIVIKFYGLIFKR